MFYVIIWVILGLLGAIAFIISKVYENGQITVGDIGLGFFTIVGGLVGLFLVICYFGDTYDRHVVWVSKKRKKLNESLQITEGVE